MGLSRYFYTDEIDPKPMTSAEVKAGVQAIKAVAERRRDEFQIDSLTETSILVNVRSRNRVEGFCFDPIVTEGGYVQKFNFCKTNRCPEDAGVAEMIEALQQAVNNKLHISDND